MLQQKDNSGSALIIAFIMAVVLVGLTGSLLHVCTTYAQTTQVHNHVSRAQYVAEAGLSAAAIVLNFNTGTTEVQGNADDWDSVIYQIGSGEWRQVYGDLPPANFSEHARTVYVNRDRSLIERPDNDFKVRITAIGDDYRVVSSGIYSGLGRAIEGYIQRVIRPAAIPTGFGGDALVIVKGATSGDSYDSSVGNYSATNMNEDAHFFSNGMIDTGGRFIIYGKVDLGQDAGGTDATIDDPSRVTTGEINEMGTHIDFPEVDTAWEDVDFVDTWPSGAVTLSSDSHYGDVTLSTQDSITVDGEVTLYIHGKFDAAGQSVINIPSGSKLTVYVSDTVKFSGQLNSADFRPEQFIINSTYDSTDTEFDENWDGETGSWGVKMSGNSQVAAVVYAPKSYVIITGQNDFFGAMVGYVLKITGAMGDGCGANGRCYCPLCSRGCKVHEDESLRDRSAPSYSYYLRRSSIKSTGFQE